MNKIIIAVIVLLAGGGAVLLTKKPVEPTPTEPVVVENQTADTNTPAVEETMESVTVQNEAVAPATKEFIVTGSSYAFDPSTITVNKGDKVKITFKNSGGMHDWKIDELDLATKKIKTGEEEVLEFVADKVGMFEYYCSVGEHRAKGMKGTLVVK
jgi:plastocyanin